MTATKAKKSKKSRQHQHKDHPDKSSTEYLLKRERNNIAVRKSREKAKKNFRDLQNKEILLQVWVGDLKPIF